MLAMNAKLKQVARPRVDEWKEFRPEVVSRRPARSATPKLLILSFLTGVFLLSWVFFKVPIIKTAAEIKSAISQFGQSRVAATEGPPATPAVARRTQRPSRLGRSEPVQDFAREPGPFEVYLLDGDRFIRVDSRDKSVLLNMQTGETTWMDSPAAAEGRR
jgi:hypothetical protein